MRAFPLHCVDGMPGMLEGQESRLPDPALLLTGHLTLDVSLPPRGSGLHHQSDNEAALDHSLQPLGRSLRSNEDMERLRFMLTVSYAHHQQTYLR